MEWRRCPWPLITPHLQRELLPDTAFLPAVHRAGGDTCPHLHPRDQGVGGGHTQRRAIKSKLPSSPSPWALGHSHIRSQQTCHKLLAWPPEIRLPPMPPKTWHLPASHLRSPARQTRPPPEREARRCSLMASVGGRSHKAGGPVNPRPAGSGSHSLWRCRVAIGQAAGMDREAASGQHCLTAGRTSASAACPAWPEFPFPSARPAPHPHPDTCDHSHRPVAGAKGFLGEDGTLTRFLNLSVYLKMAQPECLPCQAGQASGLQRVQQEGVQPVTTAPGGTRPRNVGSPAWEHRRKSFPGSQMPSSQKPSPICAPPPSTRM